ncbi:MAG: SPOR domain-containing protein [Betaproteobacteria bacterium]|jgi:DedD protein|nr:SPOR domain-containing protein [Betaproteobacteria bacterium]
MSADRESRSHQRDEQASDPMADHKRRARWRLLGAVIIVAAVAGLAPLLLEDQARPLSQDLLIEIPSRNSVFSKIESLRPVSPPSDAPAEEKTRAVEPKLEAKSEVKAESKPESKLKPEVKAEPKTEPKSEPKAEPKSPPKQEPKSEPKTEPKKSSASSGFLVQVGAYSKLEAANTVKARLASGGHRVILETIKLDDGSERHRVRIGPFETRELANQVRDRAKSQGYDAIVVTP